METVGVPPAPAIVLALVNNKGGVGKTTTAVNLAAALSGHPHRVLLIDLDSQASASLSLGTPKGALVPSVAEVMVDGRPLTQSIRQTSVKGLDLVPSSRSLGGADLALSGMKGREYRLKAALEPARSTYGYVILDCPPSLSLLSVNALVAADAFIVPVTPQYLALEGLVNLLEAIDRIRQSTHGGAALLGVLLTMADYRTKAAVEISEMIRGHYKSLVFHTEIKVNARLAEAPSFGQTIFDYAGQSPAADAYRRLCGEVRQRSRQVFRH